MARYQVALIQQPDGWQPARPDDVPPRPGAPLTVLAEADDLLVAVRQSVEHNVRPPEDRSGCWAVVAQPGSRGQIWPTARLRPKTRRVRLLQPARAIARRQPGWRRGWERDER